MTATRALDSLSKAFRNRPETIDTSRVSGSSGPVAITGTGKAR